METAEQTPELSKQLAAIGAAARIESLPARAVSGQNMVRIAEAFEIVDTASAATCADWRNECLDEIAKIEKEAEEGRGLADRLHKWIVKQIKMAIEPYESAKAILNRKLTAWQDAEAARIAEKNRLAEERERQAELDRRTRELRERIQRMRDQALIEGEPEALQITDAGVAALDNLDAFPPGSPERETLLPLAKVRADNERAAAEAAARAQPKPEPVAMSTATLGQHTVHKEPIFTSTGRAEQPKIAGNVGRDTWVGEVYDLGLLIKAAAENPEAYAGLLMANQTAVDARARNEKEKLRVPGVKPKRVPVQARSRR
jgi:hypothetical protein